MASKYIVHASDGKTNVVRVFDDLDKAEPHYNLASVCGAFVELVEVSNFGMVQIRRHIPEE